MLELDSSRWHSLTHAYGTAKDTPGLLRQLSGKTEPLNGYESEPWYSLWSSLCHQGDAYDASYAAVPHIVEIAVKARGRIDFSFFLLPASIEIARQNGLGPSIPHDLEAAYQTGLKRLLTGIAAHMDEAWDNSTLISAIAALAVAKGHSRIAQAISNLDEELIARLIDLDFDV